MNYGKMVNSGELLASGRQSVPAGVTLPRIQQRRSLRVAKRAVDIVGALLGILLLAPVFLFVALLVKFTSKGPILFRQDRLGQHGNVFQCLKFRTMVVNAEEVLRQNPALLREFEANFKLKQDPRITPVGGLLRRTSLDELPQFVNVLLGEMSLIGPRPIVPKEIEKYHVYGDKLLSVKPGLSGMWQVNGRSDTTYDERILMDMEYIDHCSISLDIQLVFLTVVGLFRRRGAY